MSRIRTIKPELLDDERVASLPHGVFRMYISCLLLADDFGNLRAEERYLFGRTIVAVDGATVEDSRNFRDKLASVGLLELYVLRGQTYAHIHNWDRHQKVDHPGKPKVPGPDDQEVECLYVPPNVPSLIRETLANVSRVSLETLATDQDLGSQRRTIEKDHREGAREGAPTPSGAEGGPGGGTPIAKPKGRRQSKPETDCPPTEASSSEVEDWCGRWGIPVPDQNAEVTGFLNHHRSKETRFRDWLAAWRKWESNARRWGSAGPTRIVQGHDPAAPWLKAAREA